MAVLELHITRNGIWKGAWDGVAELDFVPAAFNLTYTPHVLTSAFFKRKTWYRSCDVHFDFAYLQALSPTFLQSILFYRK